jgi:hypothetical protein
MYVLVHLLVFEGAQGAARFLGAGIKDSSFAIATACANLPRRYRRDPPDTSLR